GRPAPARGGCPRHGAGAAGRGRRPRRGVATVVLGDAKGFVFDVDGTLVHRDGDEVHVQPGAVEVLARIRASGRPLAIFTNGSHESPAWFAAGLRAAGLEIADDEMLTPLRSVQTYLRTRRLAG